MCHQATGEDFGTVLDVIVKQEQTRLAVAATISFSSEAEARTAAMALKYVTVLLYAATEADVVLSGQTADGRVLEAYYKGANAALRAILPHNATEQHSWHLLDRPSLPAGPVASTSGFRAAGPTAPTSASLSAPQDSSGSRTALPPVPALSSVVVEDERPASLSGWSSSASTFAPSAVVAESRQSTNSAESGLEKKTFATDMPKGEAGTADDRLAGNALPHVSPVAAEQKLDVPQQAGAGAASSESLSPRWNAAASVFVPCTPSRPSRMGQSHPVPSNKATGHRKRDSVISIASPGRKRRPLAIKVPPVTPVREEAKKPAAVTAVPVTPVQEEAKKPAALIAVPVDGFVSAQSKSPRSSQPSSQASAAEASEDSAIIARASPKKAPRSFKLDAKPFVPFLEGTIGLSDSVSAAYLAGQAVAMAQYGLGHLSVIPATIPSFVVHDHLNPLASTFQPAPVETPTRALNTAATPFTPNFTVTGSFGSDLQPYSSLLRKAGVDSIADLKDMLDKAETANEFVDDLRKEYPDDLATLKDAFKLKLLIRKAIGL